MSERTKWCVAYAASYSAGLAVLAIGFPVWVASGWFTEPPLRLIARTAREHADEFFPDGAPPRPAPAAGAR